MDDIERLAEFLGSDVEVEWLRHVLKKWDEVTQEASCGCWFARDADCLSIHDGFCPEWKGVRLRQFMDEHDGLSPDLYWEKVAREQRAEALRREEAWAVEEQQRSEEWAELERRGLTP